MRRGVLAAAIGMTLLLDVASAPARGQNQPPPAAAGPEAYVRWVYSRYGPGSDFDSTSVYTPGLRALFKLNSRLLGPDEVGENNDSDEICQCQDWDRLRVESLSLIGDGAHRATVRVGFVNAGAHETVALTLLLTSSGWRVDDVLHPRPGDSESLRVRLMEENRRLRLAVRPKP